MPVVLVVLGFGLVIVGLVFAFGGLAGDRAGGGARDIRLEGPAWLILVALGVAVILFGVWRFDGDGSDGGGNQSEDSDEQLFADLADACGFGDWQACNDLYFLAPVGSDWELWGASCGGIFGGSIDGLINSGTAGNC